MKIFEAFAGYGSQSLSLQRLKDNFTDFDIDKLMKSGISNSQLYKLAGNSIVVSCLYHIFRKLFVETENENKQLELF